MQPPILDYAHPTDRPWHHHLVPIFYIATLLPFLAGFWFLHAVGPGELRNRWHGIVSTPFYGWDARAAWPWYILSIWAAISAAIAALRPQTVARMSLLRIGLYVGIGVSAYFLPSLLMMPTGDDSHLTGRLIMAAVCTATFLGYGCYLAYWPTRHPVGQYLLSITVATAIYLLPAGLGLLMFEPGSVPEALWITLVLIPTPILPFITFCFLARTIRQYDSSRLDGPKAVAAVTPALLANWVIAYLAHDAIASTARSLSYIATAASRGHPGFVGTRPLHLAGHSIRINPQLRTLICAEVTLRHTHIRLARQLRRLYDRIGPTLASQLNAPWKADMTYLLLKPLEVAAALYLRHHRINPTRLLPIPSSPQNQCHPSPIKTRICTEAKPVHRGIVPHGMMRGRQ